MRDSSSPRLGTRVTRRLLVCLLLAASCIASAQMLARPGGHGYGFNADPWWKHAIFYEVSAPPADSPVDFRAITARLDALRSLGVDALILPAPALPPPGAVSAAPDSSLDALDDLLRQSGGHGIRVLLTLNAASPAADISGLARFWLNRGVAGLYLAAPAGTTPEQTQAMVQALRKAASGVLGQRIIVSGLDLAPAAVQNTRPSAAGKASRIVSSSAAQLQIDSRANSLPSFDAASLRPLLAQTTDQTNLLLDLPTPASDVAPPPLADAVAAIALLAHPSTLIDSTANLVLEPTPERPAIADQSETPAKPAPAPPQPPPGVYLPYVPYVPPAKPRPAEAPKPPPPPDPLTTWYRQLADLHHDNAALRSGSKIFLDFDAQNTLVWVSRPAGGAVHTPPVFVVCNLSSAPVQFSLAAEIKRLDLHGTFLQTLLRSYPAMGAQDLNAVKLPAYGVFIGDLRR